MMTLESLPNFSAKDLVQSHLAIDVIKQVNSQIPVHFFYRGADSIVKNLCLLTIDFYFYWSF